MPKNILFGFLSYRRIKKHTPLKHAESTTLKQTVDKKNYFLIELPTKNYRLEGLDNRFILTKHHVSIYEKDSQANPHLSQLHYTADFVDKEGQEYRLHVYYNQKDQMVSGPHFSKRMLNGKYRSIDVDTVSQELLDLAEDSIHDVIIEIREKYLQTYNQLEQEYQHLEEECAVLFNSKDTKGYLGKLKSLIKVTNNLAMLTSHNHFVHKHIFLTRMLENALHQAAAKQKAAADNQSESPTVTPAGQSEQLKQPAQEKSTPKSQSKRKLTAASKQTTSGLRELEDKIDQLANKLEQLTTKDSIENRQEHSKSLGNLWALCNQYSLEADLLLPTKRPSNLPCLNKLERLSVTIEKVCKLYFLNLLKNSEFAAAKTLQSFYYLLDSNMMCTALQQNNAGLLNFILTHGDDIVLDNQVLIINKKRYANAITFCYQHQLADCLAVLINHDASILIPGSDGMPLAYTLLTQPKHPLSAVLPLCAEKTTASSLFYSRLKNALRHYITTHPLNDLERNEINAAIAHYQALTNDLRFNRELGFAGQTLNISCSAIAVLMNKPLPVEFLQNDSIQYLHNQCIENALQFFQLQERNKKTAMVKLFSDNSGNLSDLFHQNEIPERDSSAKMDFMQRYLVDINNMWLDLIENARNARKMSSPRAFSQRQSSFLNTISTLYSRYGILKNLIAEDMSSEEDVDTSDTQDLLLQFSSLLNLSNPGGMGFFGQSAVTAAPVGAPTNNRLAISKPTQNTEQDEALSTQTINPF